MRMRTVLLAVPAALALLAAPAAHADWYRHGGWGGPRYAPHYAYHGGAYYHGGVVGPVVAGALVLGAVAASVLAPPVVYAPPPVYYAPPPVYYAPPPVVYAPPAYYRAW